MGVCDVLLQVLGWPTNLAWLILYNWLHYRECWLRLVSVSGLCMSNSFISVVLPLNPLPPLLIILGGVASDMHRVCVCYC